MSLRQAFIIQIRLCNTNYNRYLYNLLMQYQEGQELEQGEQVSEKEQSSQFIIVKHAGKKELCQVCESALKKYKCPRCGKKSCGVACLNKHKKIHSCSGVADLFVKIEGKQIEDKQVQKDYTFVKDMLASSDKVKKTLSGVDAFGQQPKRFKIMRINAKKLYNITLLNAPPIIERHRQNISFYFVKTKTFYWVVQILFWRTAEDKEYCSRVLTPPTADSLTAMEVIPEDFLCRDLLQMGINTQKKEEFEVFLQKKVKSNTKVAVKLRKESLLCECLANQTIYQFPTLIVVHRSLEPKYLQRRGTEQKQGA